MANNAKFKPVKDFAVSGNYTIHIVENGDIKVFSLCDVSKDALKDISHKIGFNYGDWDTRTFGAKLAAQLNGGQKTSHALSGDYVINILTSGKVLVYKAVPDTLGALKEIADQIKFSYDAGLDTNTLGGKMIDFINGDTPTYRPVKDFAVSGNYTIHVVENGDIKVFSLCNVSKDALKDISHKIGFNYGDWDTRTFGAKLAAQLNGGQKTSHALSGDYVINIQTSGTVLVYKAVPDTLGTLKEIADQIKFSYDAGLDANTLGGKMIDFINGDVIEEPIKDDGKTRFEVKPGKLVSTLQEEFKAAFGANLRAYYMTEKFELRKADPNNTLNQIAAAGGCKEGIVAADENTVVSDFEKQFRDLGVLVQISNSLDSRLVEKFVTLGVAGK